MEKLLKPGQKSRVSAQLELIGPRGGEKGIEITAIKGKPLPPTPKPHMFYKVVDKTKHKS